MDRVIEADATPEAGDRGALVAPVQAVKSGLAPAELRLRALTVAFVPGRDAAGGEVVVGGFAAAYEIYGNPAAGEGLLGESLAHQEAGGFCGVHAPPALADRGVTPPAVAAVAANQARAALDTIASPATADALRPLIDALDRQAADPAAWQVVVPAGSFAAEGQG